MKKYLVQFILCCAIFSTVKAQEEVSFKTEKSFYIYGDAVAIGNNSLSKDAKKPYKDFTFTNDDIDMVYVDVDDDESTFSSSTASLQLPDNQNNIAYAVLYWTATYSYIKGGRREDNGQFYFNGRRQRNRSLINKVKFKLPGNKYQDIKGKVIFDGAKKPSFALNAPYACYADVTSILKNAETLNGDYTVANIFATEGFVSGGSAAGWMLYIVYEAPTDKPKYITTFNGFAQIASQPVKITLDNFKTPETGETSTNMTLVALEGDSALTEDECVIANPKLKSAFKLSNTNRTENNFFSSHIDQNEQFTSRFPSSENTLGFDIVSLSLSNPKQEVITNNTDEVELFFNTKKDLFYVFFTAFQTEISESFYEEVSGNLPEKAVALESAKPKIEEVVVEEPVVQAVVVKEEKPIVKETVSAIAKVETKEVVQTIPTTKIETPEVTLKQPKKEIVKPVSVEIATMSKAQKEAVKTDGVYITSGTYAESLKINDNPLETQQFKLILEKNAAEIEGVKKGYYVINKFFSNPLNAVAWNKDLIEKGYPSDILIDEENKLYYVYVFHTENFYDAFMQHKTLLANEFFKENWVFKINMTEF